MATVASSSKGAAEPSESGPEGAPGGSPASSATITCTAGAAASYDPLAYQPPHPDDAGGGGPTKAANKTNKKGKGKGAVAGRCGNCDAEGAVMKCSQCGTKVYCDESCQQVRSTATVVVVLVSGGGGYV